MTVPAIAVSRSLALVCSCASAASGSALRVGGGLVRGFLHVCLQPIVEPLVLRVGAHRHRGRHHLRPADPGDGLRHARADDRTAVAAVGQDDDPDALTEAGHLVEHLVVDQLAVVEAPGLVLRVRLVAAAVVNLAAVSRVADEEEIAVPERLGRGAHRLENVGARRLLREQDGRLQALRRGERGHVFRVELARHQVAAPSGIVLRVHGIEADVERQPADRLRRRRAPVLAAFASSLSLPSISP